MPAGAAAISLLAVLAGFPRPDAPVAAAAVAAPAPPRSEHTDRELEEWLDHTVAGDAPEPALAEAVRGRRLSTRMLYLLLFVADPQGWAELRAAAWAQLGGNPLSAGGVVTLHIQVQRGPSARYLEFGDPEFAGSTVVAVAEDDQALVVGEPVAAATGKGARAGAALALIPRRAPRRSGSLDQHDRA